MRDAEWIDGSDLQAGSPLMLCDHFLRLAKEVDEAGFRVAAEHLLYLADQVLDNPASLAD